MGQPSGSNTTGTAAGSRQPWLKSCVHGKERVLDKEQSEAAYLRKRDKVRRITGPFRREAALERKHTWWSIFVMFLSFALSILLLIASGSLFDRTGLVTAMVVVAFIILVGIVFDMIGVAVAAAEETPFHSMASRKVFGARQSIRLIRSAPRVSSFCNDVIGDICGVVSGTAGAAIIFRMFAGASDTTWAEALMGAGIAALTVGGKAFGKHFSIRNSNYIIYLVGRVLALFEPSNRKSRAQGVKNGAGQTRGRNRDASGGNR